MIMTDTLEDLETKIDHLIHLCHQLKNENKHLRSQQRELTAERDELLSKNNVARSKVENMLNRLKQLEAATHE